MGRLMPAKNLKAVSVYLKPEIYEALQELAKQDDRSVSNLCARLLEERIKNPPINERSEGGVKN